MKRLTIQLLFLICVAWPALAGAQEDRTTRALAYFHRIVVEDYDRVGRRDPAWDADARPMLEALSRVLALEYSPEGDEYDVMFAGARRIHDAGCTDPLVLLAAARSYTYFGRKYEDTTPLYVESAKRMTECAYHPLLKAMTSFRAAGMRGRSKVDAREARREARRMVSAGMAALPRMLADKDVPVDSILSVFDSIDDTSLIVERDRPLTFNLAMPILEQNLGNHSLVLTVKSEYLLDYAMDTRRPVRPEAGGEPQPLPDADKLFKDRLTEAAAAGEEAWKTDNSNPWVAVLMMRVEAARGNAKEGAKRWFDRAVAADPQLFSAYATRLEFLEPKSQGSPAEMIAFGRECSAKGRFDTGIPMLLVEAHLRAASLGPEGADLDEPRREYFSVDPSVWDDIKSVYEPYLRKYAASRYHRSRYAQLACWCGQWIEADRQFKLLGDGFSLSWFRNREAFVKQRNEAQDHAAARQGAAR